MKKILLILLSSLLLASCGTFEWCAETPITYHQIYYVDRPVVPVHYHYYPTYHKPIARPYQPYNRSTARPPMTPHGRR